MIKLKDLIDGSLKEGLSFSDYFDDSIPYESKPVPCLTPMEEGSNIDTTAYGYWASPSGELHKVGYEDHYGWAYDYLSDMGKKEEADASESIYELMYSLRWIRVYNNSPSSVYFNYSKLHPPSQRQMASLKDLAILQNKKLVDGTLDKDIDLLQEEDIPIQSHLRWSRGQKEQTLISRRGL